MKDTKLPTLQGMCNSIRKYLQSKRRWYLFSIGATVATLFSVFAISEDAFPLNYLRYVLSLVFLCWLPGYCFAKTLSLEDSFDTAIQFLLHIPLSLSLVFFVCLVVNFFPGGLRLTSVVGAVAVFTTVSATVALFLDQRKTRKTDNSKDTDRNKTAGLHQEAT